MELQSFQDHKNIGSPIAVERAIAGGYVSGGWVVIIVYAKKYRVKREWNSWDGF